MIGKGIIFCFTLLLFSRDSIGQHVIPMYTAAQASQAKKELENTGNNLKKAEKLFNLSYYHLTITVTKRQRNLDSARIYLAKGTQVASMAGNKPGLLMSKIIKGEYFYVKGRPDSARLMFKQAIESSKLSKNLKMEGIAWFHLSKALIRFKGADMAMQKSTACFKAANEPILYRIALDKTKAGNNAINDNNIAYAISFRRTDSLLAPKFKKELATGATGKNLSDICFNLSSIYTYKKGNHLKNADSILYFARLAVQLSSPSQYKANQSEAMIWTGLSYFRRGHLKKIDEITVDAPDSVKYILWFTLANHYYKRPMKNNRVDEVALDSSVHYHKLGLLLALAKKEKYMIKVATDGLLRTATTYAAGWNSDKAKNILLFIKSNKLKNGYPSNILLNNKLYYIYVNQGSFFEAMKCAIAINKEVTPDSIPLFRHMGYYTLSSINFQLRNYRQSNIYIEKALQDKKLFEENIASIYDMVDAYYENMRYLHEVPKAITMIQKVRQTYPPIYSTDSLWYHFILGKSYMQLKDYQLAQSHLEKAVEISRRVARNQGHIQAVLATVHFLKGDAAHAKKLIAPQLANPVPSATYRVSLYNWGAKIDSTLTEYESAYRLLMKSQRLSDSLYNREGDQHIRELAYLQESQRKQAYLTARENRISLLNIENRLLEQKAKVRRRLISYQGQLRQQASTKVVLNDKSIMLLRSSQQQQRKELLEAQQMKEVIVVFIFLISLLIILLIIYLSNKKKVGLTITEKNTQMETLLGEKSLLVKEMHHRVKNNLHMVISLLDAQAPSLKDNALQAVRNSQHKIFAMSLIHQKLYQTEDMQTIRIDEYIIDLTSYLKESFDKNNLVRFTHELEPIEMDITNAVQLALILDEVIAFYIKSSASLQVTSYKLLLQRGPGKGCAFIFELEDACPQTRKNISRNELDLGLIDDLAQKLQMIVEIDKSGTGRFAIRTNHLASTSAIFEDEHPAFSA